MAYSDTVVPEQNLGHNSMNGIILRQILVSAIVLLVFGRVTEMLGRGVAIGLALLFALFTNMALGLTQSRVGRRCLYGSWVALLAPLLALAIRVYTQGAPQMTELSVAIYAVFTAYSSTGVSGMISAGSTTDKLLGVAVSSAIQWLTVYFIAISPWYLSVIEVVR